MGALVLYKELWTWLPNRMSEVIVLGGGCFWCVDAAIRRLKGVIEVISGYSGGHTKDPTYKEVCTGSTNHAEVVKVTFDPSIVTLEAVMAQFLKVHDPSQLNRQGEEDVGTQYRSVIFYTAEQQVAAIRKALHQWEKEYGRPVVTEILPLAPFYPAEEYHQDYYARNKDTNSYCQRVVKVKLDKVAKLEAH
eukprot:Protomagalhaensia_sp_Gyna_25__5434@NODE_70_length_5637_cov_174_525366_g52_i0_p5_GENE_NODE_70_length_5637_cov_174_525366_g52_i0NODE_70_length_5637_cov_174_525366_g52_i0_p5_ORF_typecomplete_len191_score35_40PMSR/PF01625_21/1_1e60_NODE_70_length_5637_cov_174_525366_g52_i017642336